MGLTELGERPPHPELERAIGAGRKISDTLLDFAGPILEAEPADERTVKDLLAFAVAAWNAAILQVETPAALGNARRELARQGHQSKLALERFDMLARRKLERFPEDRRMVGDFAVRKQNGAMGISMSAQVGPKLLEQLRAAKIQP